MYSSNQSDDRIINDLNKLPVLSELIKKQNKTIGYISGCFDLIHIGHINLFRFAKTHVDILFVGIDSDEYIKNAKGLSRPFFEASTRLTQLEELRSVDYVLLLQGNYTPNSKECDSLHRTIISKLKPDILFEGQISCFTHQKIKLAEELQIKFYNSPNDIIYPTSTSLIADAICKNSI
ncbi:MAG: hypothetical protein EHM93_20060 [Bacteroidales bacterium]|nr:MAG: hypothetical protein EHM93_20060 [Bacteroidales bacterium]